MKDNIKMNLMEIYCKCMNWIEPAWIESSVWLCYDDFEHGVSMRVGNFCVN